MNRAYHRALFFGGIGAGTLGMLVLAGLTLGPLWLRYRAVTKLIEAVKRASYDNLEFWHKAPVSSTLLDETPGWRELFERVRVLGGVEDASCRLASFLDDSEDVELQLRVIHALYVLGGDVSVSTASLEQALSEPVLRAPAAELLEKIGPAAKSAFPSLLAALRAEQEKDYVRWRLLDATRAVDPEGAAEALAFSPTLLSLNAASAGFSAGDADPVALVRAVNHLRSLGRDRAIEALRRYVELAFVNNPPSRRNDAIPGIDESNQQVLHVIIPLVFEPMDPAEVPTDSRWFEPRETALPVSGWAGFLVIVEGDYALRDVKLRKPFTSMKCLVDWAGEQGKIRDRPLRLVDDPIAAADRLIEEWIEGTSAREDMKNWPADSLAEYINEGRLSIRSAAWRCIAPLFSSSQSPEPQSAPLDDAAWNDIKQRASQRRIRWDEQRQEYVAGGSVAAP